MPGNCLRTFIISETSGLPVGCSSVIILIKVRHLDFRGEWSFSCNQIFCVMERNQLWHYGISAVKSQKNQSKAEKLHRVIRQRNLNRNSLMKAQTKDILINKMIVNVPNGIFSLCVFRCTLQGLFFKIFISYLVSISIQM